jgi:hypothetical protein
MADTVINIYALILLMTLFQALLFAILLIIRAIRENIYADFILSGLIFLLGLSTLPHLLGWLSIGVLWNDFTFLPWNGLELAILPTAYLFLLSRLNSNWRLKREHIKHYWLYLIYFFYHLIVGLQGKIYAKWWWFEVTFIDQTAAKPTALMFTNTPATTINVYPNPTMGEINVTADVPIQRLILTNLAGQILLNEQNSSLNMCDLSAGTYFLSIETASGKSVRKIIKQ